MNVNLPVWDYYPKDDKPFTDPLYAPYIKHPIATEDGVCPVNTWSKQGYSDGFVNPGLVRKGWGLGFQLMHPHVDTCPEGWTKGEDGWCAENEPEFGDHGLYSKKAFVPKYQYWDSYAPKIKNAREINQFDRKSVNPWTGNYNVSYLAKPASNRVKYGHLASKDSLIA